MTVNEKGNKEPPIPELVKIAYALELDTRLPGLSATMKQTGAFESGCRYWMNNQLDRILEKLDGKS